MTSENHVKCKLPGPQLQLYWSTAMRIRVIWSVAAFALQRQS